MVRGMTSAIATAPPVVPGAAGLDRYHRTLRSARIMPHEKQRRVIDERIATLPEKSIFNSAARLRRVIAHDAATQSLPPAHAYHISIPRTLSGF
jgi:hypothetical protein